MTQYGYEPLSPEDSGSALLERLNGVVPALLTSHKGAARPGYVQPGMMWIDDSGATWLLSLYDGNSDVLMATINPKTHTVTLAGLPAFKSDGSAGAPVAYGPDGELVSYKSIISGPANAQQWLSFAVNGVERWLAYRDADDSFNIWSHDLGTALRIDASTNIAQFIKSPTAPTPDANDNSAKLATTEFVKAALSGFAGSDSFVGIRVFTTSQSIAPSAGVTKWLGYLVGGGGGGGGANGGMPGGGGGGGGGGCCLFGANVNPATSYSLVVGAGGAAGGSSGTAPTGGTSTLVIGGTTYSAAGGTGGTANATYGGAGGVGGSASGGAVFPGEAGDVGQGGSAVNFVGGKGGAAAMGLGQGGKPPAVTSGGYPGSGLGGGGGAATNAAANGGSNQVGGAGAAGGLILFEYKK